MTQAPPQIHERTFATAEAAAEALAGAVADALRGAGEARGRAALAVSGGKSPVVFFAALNRQPIDWTRVSITLVDERWVDAATADSNEHLLRSTLLAGPAGAARFVPLKTAAANPSAAVAERTAALAQLPHPLDVVVLGMGDDGHTASLFPGRPGLEAALDPAGEARLAEIVPASAPHPRLGMTLRAILDSRLVCLQIQGPAKRRVYERARAGVSPLEMPIAAVLSQAAVPVAVYLID